MVHTMFESKTIQSISRNHKFVNCYVIADVYGYFKIDDCTIKKCDRSTLQSLHNGNWMAGVCNRRGHPLCHMNPYDEVRVQSVLATRSATKGPCCD